MARIVDDEAMRQLMAGAEAAFAKSSGSRLMKSIVVRVWVSGMQSNLSMRSSYLEVVLGGLGLVQHSGHCCDRPTLWSVSECCVLCGTSPLGRVTSQVDPHSLLGLGPGPCGCSDPLSER